MPSITTKKEYKQRIAMINIVMVVYNVEEGIPSWPYIIKKRSIDTINISLADLVPKR